MNKETALENQLQRLDRRLRELYQRSDQFTRWRLSVFLVGAVISFAAASLENRLGLLAAVLFLAIFVGVARAHGQIKTAIQRFSLWKQIKAEHLARLRLDWERLPRPTVEDFPPEHPFALDLDMIGERSVHHLLDTAISQGGSERLADWLLTTRPDLPTIQRRQTVLRTLIPLDTFRDKLTLSARMVSIGLREQFDGIRLLRWLEAQPADRVSVLRGTLSLLLPLAALHVGLFLLSRLVTEGFLTQVWILALVAYLGVSVLQWRRLGGLFDEALRLRAELSRLEAVLHYVETSPHTRLPALRQVCAPFLEADSRPSRQLRRVGRVLSAASLQRNPVLWLWVNLVFPWDVFFAYQLERSKRDLAEALPRWLDALHELEALNALATFAALNPGHVFPTLEPNAVFKGAKLGHPLIPAATRVTNDFALDSLGRVVIITGSNMSGKSSFLRTLGVNLQLAYAGGVVAAEGFHAGLFRTFACIRVSDSVVDGFSYFYAEVRRLKALLLALREVDAQPLFFLIDEIFRGTNNRERLIGSRAYIRALVGGNGTGLISTHDLELVRLADDIPQIENRHFREEVHDGRMVFDYALRSGPSPTTNALKIMRLEGLPVEENEAV
ncbi:MAG: hypothetical protein SF029_08720 [bacterium]|nr:hypothetical protein [bacterium]